MMLNLKTLKLLGLSLFTIFGSMSFIKPANAFADINFHLKYDVNAPTYIGILNVTFVIIWIAIGIMTYLIVNQIQENDRRQQIQAKHLKLYLTRN